MGDGSAFLSFEERQAESLPLFGPLTKVQKMLNGHAPRGEHPVLRSSSIHAWRPDMANKEQRGNREKRKPKKEKPKPQPQISSFSGAGTKSPAGNKPHG
jgi:hypothetical protein